MFAGTPELEIAASAIRLTRDFYSVGAADLAPRLLGQIVVRVLPGGERLAGVIVEAEAYLGVKDRASHAFGGRRTPRNETMYARPGTAYVYFTYGMHFCMNVVCGELGEPAAVLIRALHPIEGLEVMADQRAKGSVRSGLKVTELCSGPGKLCRALAIDRSLDGVDLCTCDGLWVAEGPGVLPRRTRRASRVGLGFEGPWARRRLRWLVAGNPHLSSIPRAIRKILPGSGLRC
ncbi:Putative 3-methyladenine DNA glycosylase [Phycisphaerales bacterium]|nr:Putative 3-methyladenine DNA glycosylase [Phycisphaerales bacterium]